MQKINELDMLDLCFDLHLAISTGNLSAQRSIFSKLKTQMDLLEKQIAFDEDMAMYHYYCLNYPEQMGIYTCENEKGENYAD